MNALIHLHVLQQSIVLNLSCTFSLYQNNTSHLFIYSTCFLLRACFVLLQMGRTALHVATIFGHEKVVELLVRAGADVNKADKVSIFQCSHVIYGMVGCVFIIRI